MVCAGDPTVCEAPGDADDLSAQHPRPYNDIFKYRADGCPGGAAGSSGIFPAPRGRVPEAEDEVRGGCL